MTDRTSQLAKLVSLLEAVFQAKQSEMSSVISRISELQSQLYALDHPKHAAHNTPAMRAGANLLWDTWVEDRKLLIGKELLEAARQREALRAEVAHALAKAEAARTLLDRTTREDRKLSERRSSW